MSQKFKTLLKDHNKFISDDIQLIQSGAKLSSLRREVKPKQKELRRQLMNCLEHVAKTGQISQDLWNQFRNFLAIVIKETLDRFNEKFHDSKSFEDEKEVILQYIIYFERPPFTIQRIAELTLSPDKYYKSCKKLLYAFEKLVNVADPQDR